MRALRAHPFSKNRRLALDNQNRFTFSQIRYIICIYRLTRKEEGVKSIDIANALGFSKPSVHNMLKSLADLGVVRRETFGLAYLTDEGRIIARKYTVCYAILERKMADICGGGAASENAICGLLADMPTPKIDELYDRSEKRK